MKNEEETILKDIYILCMNLSAAVCALLAAYYWYKSSVTEIHGDDIPEGSDKRLYAFRVGSDRGGYSVVGTMHEASRRNSIAARWAAASAIFVVLSLVPDIGAQIGDMS